MAKTKSNYRALQRGAAALRKDEGKWSEVPGGLAGPTHTKRRVLDDGTTIEVWDDPKWTSALSELRARRPRALGELLRKERVVPEDIAYSLGTMLAPPKGYRGARLMVRVPARWTLANAADAEKHAVHLEIKKAQTKYPKLEAAIAAVATQRKARGLPHSRRYLLACWKVDSLEVVLRSQRHLGRIGSAR